MDVKETPFVLIARVKVKPGKVENYLKIAEEVDKAVEKSEPGMLFHNFDSDPSNELKFTWNEISKNYDALILQLTNQPIGKYVEQHFTLA